VRKRHQMKGIFCLEGLWDPDLRVGSTVRPLLELLRLNEQISYVHRECATIEEFEFYVTKWVQKRYDPYPILYLASHGKENGIQLGQDFYLIDDLAELLASKCSDRVIMFSSCSTMGISLRHLRQFLEKTGALAVCGYRVDVDWMRSTAFELLLFLQMQNNEFSGRGIEAIQNSAAEIAKTFSDLDFRMVSVKDLAA